MLTPNEIQTKTFAKGLKGYNVAEVEDYLVMVSRAMEMLVNENHELRQELETSERRIKHYTEIEDTMKESLILAQQTSQERMNDASEKAKYIVERAEEEAKHRIEQGNEEVFEAKKRLEEVKMDHRAFIVRAKADLQAQLGILVDVDVDE